MSCDGFDINQALKKSNVKDKDRKSLTLIVGERPKKNWPIVTNSLIN